MAESQRLELWMPCGNGRFQVCCLTIRLTLHVVNRVGVEPTSPKLVAIQPSAHCHQCYLPICFPLCVIGKLVNLYGNLYSALSFISAIQPNDTLPNTWFHSYAISELISDALIGGDGAGNETWTRTVSLPQDFKSWVSANSTIPAYV